MELEEEPLAGGWQTDVRKAGDTVLRAAGPQSHAVIALLAHLAVNSFGAAPKPVGNGFAEDGREHLSFVVGETPHPLAWTEDALWQIGHTVAALHETAATFPVGGLTWRPWFARSLTGDLPVIGHGDLGPWNILVTPESSIAFIDWDNAGPVDATWELAQVVWLNAQLHDDDVATLNDLPSASIRARHAAILLDGYGLGSEHRRDFVDRLIEFAIRSARDEALGSAVGPDTNSPSANGFPLLWAVTWRARAAAWMIDHRRDLDRAFGSTIR